MVGIYTTNTPEACHYMYVLESSQTNIVVENNAAANHQRLKCTTDCHI
jgi:hypothetical protein